MVDERSGSEGSGTSSEGGEAAGTHDPELAGDMMGAGGTMGAGGGMAGAGGGPTGDVGGAGLVSEAAADADAGSSEAAPAIAVDESGTVQAES